ncbi:aldo/keto reductase [Paraburkholderia jirisanensis]
MNTRRLGRQGPPVSAIGLGCMGMSDFYGPADRDESIATLHAALDAGITLLDTGDFYGMGDNEMLIRDALRGRQRDQVIVSVKFGALRDPAGGWGGYDARPAAIRNFVTYSLRRLGTDYIDIYRPARIDPNVPIEETAGAIADLVKAGYVRHLGLSEAGADTIRRAHAVTPVADLQIEYSLMSRGIEHSILPVCRELGIGISAYGVLSRGLLSGKWTKARDQQGQQQGRQLGQTQRDFRSVSPRFQGENLERNLALVETLREVAAARGSNPAQLALAWALSRGDDIVPLIGARRREQLADALAAAQLRLDAAELARIEAAVPPDAVAGERYAPAQMEHLDSERPAGH